MKKVLVVVDMQNDFISGSLGTKEAEAIVDNVVNKIKESKENGDVIYFTMDTHGDNYLKTTEGQNLPIAHCIRGTMGHRLHPKIEALVDKTDFTIEKPTFGSPQLGKSIAGKSGDIEEVELIGLCTDICVISNALLIKAFCPDKRVSVDSSCCAGATPQGHQTALLAMQACQIHMK